MVIARHSEKMVKLSELIIEKFYEVHKDIKERRHTHYWFKGGRGSTKSM